MEPDPGWEENQHDDWLSEGSFLPSSAKKNKNNLIKLDLNNIVLNKHQSSISWLTQTVIKRLYVCLPGGNVSDVMWWLEALRKSVFVSWH